MCLKMCTCTVTPHFTSKLNTCTNSAYRTSKSLNDITCDDNGAYKDANTAKSLFYVDSDENGINFVRGVHHEGGVYAYKIREGRKYVNKTVADDKVFLLDRYYRQNKTFPKLKMTVIRIKSVNK